RALLSNPDFFLTRPFVLWHATPGTCSRHWTKPAAVHPVPAQRCSAPVSPLRHLHLVPVHFQNDIALPQACIVGGASGLNIFNHRSLYVRGRLNLLTQLRSHV